VKKIWIILSCVIVIALAYFLWPESAEDKKVRELTEQAKKAAMASNPQSGEYRTFVEENKKLFTEENMYSFAQLMDLARTGRVSLVSELWKLRSRCVPKTAEGEQNPSLTGDAVKMNMDECNIRIENFLRAQYPAPDNEKMIALFRNYLRYEDAMRSFRLPDKATDGERLELVKKKRREIFSDADANLIFGYEETKSATENTMAEFLKTSANLPADLRIKKFYEIRGKSLGDYNSAFNETEPQYTRYETELVLRSDEMAKQNNSVQMTQSVREKYFGADGARRMAQVDAEVKAERARIDAYEAAEKKFLAENASLSEETRKAKLSEMRASMLGKEEAVEYERRMQYESYLRANNMK